MEIHEINSDNILIVARFMATIKPEWWNIDGAKQQLRQGIGWYFGENKDYPSGWILCKSYDCYKTGEIECLGYNNKGIFQIGEALQPLVERSEEWARKQGYTIMRFTIGSRGLSCHGRCLENSWEELRDLKALDREEYNWFLAMGYSPSGVFPNIYGEKYHGILLVKTI